MDSPRMPLTLVLLTGVMYFLVSFNKVSGSSLYLPSDPLVQLTGETFYETIRNTPNAWFIEFYATWCGHCKRLAPTIKRMANNVKRWDHVVKVGVIACSQSDNVPLCRRMRIRNYPTIRFFPPYLKSENYRGVDYRGAPTVGALVSGIVDYVSTIRGKPRAWPIMEPLSSVQEVLEHVQYDGMTVLVIVENPADNIDNNKAKQVLFDLSGLHGIHVMRLRRADVNSGVYEVLPDGTLVNIAEGADRESLVETTLNIVQDVERPPSSHQTTQPPPTLPPPTTPTPYDYSHTSTSGLHMQDLESSLYHSLWLEVGSSYNISGPSLQALRAYIRTLARYFPGNNYVKMFLHKVDTWLHAVTGWMTGEDWVEGITKLQSPDGYIPTRERWTGCMGSKPTFRGYPCSLWQTFHSLTVNALEANIRNPQYDARAVLHTIRDYVFHFFGCRECAGHFTEMARNIDQKVHRPRDGVLWLWQAHNKANRRLAGDETEDPLHPKQEFPTGAQCPTCRISHTGRRSRGRQRNNGTEWNEEEVMIFLRRFYGKDFVIQDNLPFTFTANTARPPLYIPPETDVSAKAEQTLSGHERNINTSWNPPPATPQPHIPNGRWTPKPQYNQHRQTSVTRSTSYEYPKPWTPEPQYPKHLPSEYENPYPQTPEPRYPTQEPTYYQRWTPWPSTRRPHTDEWSNGRLRTEAPRGLEHNTNKEDRPEPPKRSNQKRNNPKTNSETEYQQTRPPNQEMYWSQTQMPYSQTERPKRYYPQTQIPEYPRTHIAESNTRMNQATHKFNEPTLRATPEPVQEEVFTTECSVVTTEWSECSQSCGSGLSSRMTTNPQTCELQRESRICQLRPCNYRFVRNQRNACGSTYRSANYLPLVFGECRSLRYLQWRYCGECPGKCCKPSLSYNKEMEFICGSDPNDRLYAYANVQIIKLCECSDCP